MSASSILFVLSEGSTLVCILPVPNEDLQMRIYSYKMNVERYSRAWAIEANINKSQMTKACPGDENRMVDS